MELFTLNTCRLETLLTGKAQEMQKNWEAPTIRRAAFKQAMDTPLNRMLRFLQGLLIEASFLDGLLKLCTVLCIVNRNVRFKKRRRRKGPAILPQGHKQTCHMNISIEVKKKKKKTPSQVELILRNLCHLLTFTFLLLFNSPFLLAGAYAVSTMKALLRRGSEC